MIIFVREHFGVWLVQNTMFRHGARVALLCAVTASPRMECNT
jgi:hypothetical protein